MTNEQAERLIASTERIATALETSIADARAVQQKDIGQALTDAMQALTDSNPLFAAASKEMKRRIEAGEPV